MGAWHIVGNGPGEIITGNNERVIRFNQPLDSNARLTITNSKLAGLKSGFFVQGKLPDKKFIRRLETNSRELENILGCKPSLGLLTIKTIREYDTTVDISCMN